MIKPESIIAYLGALALVASLPIAVRGIRRRGTGDRYEPLFWVQRAPQIAVLVNILLIVSAFEFERESMGNVFAHLPSQASGLVAWCGVALYLSGLVFVVGGWYSLGENFSTDAELLPAQSVTNRGLYRFVLHPVYSGAAQALLGAGFASGSLIARGPPQYSSHLSGIDALDTRRAYFLIGSASSTGATPNLLVGAASCPSSFRSASRPPPSKLLKPAAAGF